MHATAHIILGGYAGLCVGYAMIALAHMLEKLSMLQHVRYISSLDKQPSFPPVQGDGMHAAAATILLVGHVVLCTGYTMIVLDMLETFR